MCSRQWGTCQDGCHDTPGGITGGTDPRDCGANPERGYSSTRSITGIPVFAGIDLLGNEVYQLNLGPHYTLALNAIFKIIYPNVNLQAWKFISVPENKEEWLTKFTRFILRVLGLDSQVQNQLAQDLRGVYGKTVDLVRQVKGWNQHGQA